MTLSDEIRTPEGFLEKLQIMTPAAFAEAVADFTDADRRKLSKTAQQHAKVLRREERDATRMTGVSIDEILRRSQNRLDRKNLELAAACLGLLAVAPKSANIIPFVGARSLSETWSATNPTAHEEAAITILLDRRPEWAQQWMERQLEAGQWGWSLMWPSVKRLLDDGLCVAVDTEDFARYVHSVLRGFDLTEEPELLEYIWLQFHHSTGFLNSQGKLRKITDPAQLERWTQGADWLWHHVHQGRVPRERVIEESLAAYWRDFNNAERATLGKLLEALELTDEEFVRHQAEFRRLLTHEAPAVVSFALKMLKARKKADGFDADIVIQELSPVFLISSKTQPKSALVLLKSLVGKDSERMEMGCRVAAEALRHEEADVQEAAIKILEAWSKTCLPTEALQQSLADVFPEIRFRVETLLKAAGVEINDSDHSGEIDTSEVAAELFREIEACPPDVRGALLLDESLTAVTAGELAPQVDLDVLPVDLSRLETVEPLQSVHDLIDAVGEFIDGNQAPMQLECVLDGISRFGRNYPDDFRERVTPILARLYADNNQLSPFQDVYYFPSTYGIIFDWLKKQLHFPPSRHRQSRWQTAEKSPDIARAIDLRAGELRRSFLETRPPLPLLSLPTHEHGWIEPQEFVSRLQQYVDHEQAVSLADLRIGLLRLPPEPAFADEDLARLPSRFQRLLTYVSSGVADIQTDIDPSCWLAAGRSRNPRGDLPELSRLRIPNKAWGLASADITLWLTNSPSAREYDLWQQQKELAKQQNENGGTSFGNRLRQAGASLLAMTRYTQARADEGPIISIKPQGDGAEAEFLTVAMATRAGKRRHWYANHLPDWAEEWQAMHWPANTDGGLALGMASVLTRMDSNASSWWSSMPALRPLLWSERAWSETATKAIWLGLFAKDADVRAVAADALVEGILDGRAHPEALSPGLLELLQHPWLKLNRLGDALAEVVRVSSWAALVVAEVLNCAIAAWDEVPRDGHHVLTVQRAALMEIDGCLSEAARETLTPLKGSSKTAKLAKQLLGFRGSKVSPARKRALLEGLQCRMQRVPSS